MDGQENLKVTSFNGIKVYHCTAGKSEEQWRKEFKGRERLLKKTEEFQSRLTLIHDFSFPGCATSIKVSPDGRYIAAAGTYKPRLKLFECENMSLKVERYSDEEISKIQYLSDDYSKIACARNDRTIELHSQAGLYTTIKTPRHIRDMTFHSPTCDLFIASNADEVYRYNLEQGVYQTSIFTGFNEDNGGITAMGQNQSFPLLSLCGKGGMESWDLRDRTSVGFLDIMNTLSDAQLANKTFSTSMFAAADSSSNSQTLFSSQQGNVNSLMRSISDSKLPFEATCVRYNDETGMEVSIGLSTGHVLTYDLRSSKPLMIYDHRYDLPIHSIKYHTASRTLITADKRTCRLWDYSSSNLTTSQRHLTTINAPAPMNDLAVVDDTGMIFMACDVPQMHIYFVPRLGTVPDWAASLENLTEEFDHQQQLLLQKQYKMLATGASNLDPEDPLNNGTTNGMGMALIGAGNDMSDAVFDDSKFITREELEHWGLGHLITQSSGSMVEPYMHGFLMKLNLYEQLREVMMIEGKIAPGEMDGFYNPNVIDGGKGNHHNKIQSELEFLEESIRKEMDKSRDSGFKLDSASLPTVNKNLAALLLNQGAAGDETAGKAAGKKMSKAKQQKELEHSNKIDSILDDDRFKVLFQDEDYDVDYHSKEYRRLNPQLKKSAQLTTEALRKVADPSRSISAIKAPSREDLDSSTAEFMRAEGVDVTMQNLTRLANQTKNYEAKGLLGAVGFSKSGNESLEARGQLTSKQIKEREKGEQMVKVKLDAKVAEQREAQRVVQLEKKQKQDKLSAFLSASSSSSATDTKKKNPPTKSLITSSSSLLSNGGSSGSNNSTRGGLAFSNVKTGIGMADLLSGGNSSKPTRLGQNGTNSNLSSTLPQPTKRPLTLADRVRMEEEEKALRERDYINEQMAKKRKDVYDQAQAKDQAKASRRSASQNGKNARNVY